MTHKELKQILEESGLPVAYHHFMKKTQPPFLVFLRVDNDNISGDDTVYIGLRNYDIELYTDKKDTKKEENIEELLEKNDIFYNITAENHIESEKMYEVVYSIQI